MQSGHSLIIKPQKKGNETSLKPPVNFEVEKGGYLEFATHTTLIGLGSPAMRLEGDAVGVQYFTVGQGNI